MHPCPQCRAPLPPNAGGCPRCGWRMAMRPGPPGPFPPPPMPRPAASRGAPLFLIVGLVGGFLLLLVAGGVVGVLAYTLRSKSEQTVAETQPQWQGELQPGDRIIQIEPFDPPVIQRRHEEMQADLETRTRRQQEEFARRQAEFIADSERVNEQMRQEQAETVADLERMQREMIGGRPVPDPGSVPTRPRPDVFPPGMAHPQERFFEHMDANRDGQLTADDFSGVRAQQFETMKRMHDQNDDGTITREEFSGLGRRR